MTRYLTSAVWYKGKIIKLEKEWKEIWEKNLIPEQRLKIEYQIKFNDILQEDEEGSITESQNDIVMQFGYITLFSTVFPLASLICLVCNMITMKSIMSEFKYK